MVAGKLTSHAQRLGSARLADGISDTNQLMLADQSVMEPAAQLSGADSGDANGTCKPVQVQPGPTDSEQPIQSDKLAAASV